MEKRRELRTKKRLSCTLDVAGERYPGIVLDVSPGGMFVQVRANPLPGAEVTIELTIPGAEETLPPYSQTKARSNDGRLGNAERRGSGEHSRG